MPSPMPRSVHDLVEQQVLRWMAEQQRRAAEKRAEQPRPIITVSRQAGTRGTDLARGVADVLGYRLWDQELVQQIAEQSGAPEGLMRAVDERARNAIEDLLAGILMGDASTEKDYVARLTKLFHAIAHHGSAVVVGRGAQYVIEGEQALRVRVVAPLDVRAHTLADVRKLPIAAARGEVERLDRERHGFIKHHYKRDANDPAAYDLVVNVGSLTPPQAVDLVVAAYRAKFPKVGPVSVRPSSPAPSL
jgi:cytidylate kinase